MSTGPSPELWRRAEAVFYEVLETPAAERMNRVRRLCGGDDELEELVRGLLAEAEKDTYGGSAPEPAEAADADAPIDQETRRVGPYRLLQPLGSGGMSEVFEAERVDGEVEQRVAVKLLKEPLGSPRYGHLLRRERQILASLEHPNIARFLDAGTTAEGSPFVVMERVRGLPLIDYCDTRRLGIRKRLEIFRKICSAVELAHRNLVVHRDLKPSNILVNDEGEPKLLDFGIAKILAATDEATRTGERFHTPSYASPEQLAGGPVTTATDVYSLGVVLYRLLTGVLPRAGTTVGSGVVPEPSLACLRVGGVVAAELVQPPSARAEALGTTPQRLAEQLRGDLDAICLRCLESDPEARYGTVAGLREDLERFLDGRPVLARPQGLLVRTWKLLRRNPAATFASGLAAASWIAFSVTTVLQLDRVEAERDAAELARTEAEEMTRFLTSTFREANTYNLTDPTRQPGDEVSAREILETGTRRLETELADRPVLRARLLNTLAMVHTDLGEPEKAVELMREALDLQVRFQPDDAVTRIRYLNSLGLALGNLGHLAEARGLLEEALGLCRVTPDTPEPLLAFSLTNRGVASYLEGDLRLAADLLAESVAVQLRLEDAELVQRVETRIYLGIVQQDRGDLSAAEASFRESLREARELGPEHPSIAKALTALARVESKNHQLSAAEVHLREGIEIFAAALGEEHPNTILTRSSLGQVLRLLGRGEEAEQVLRASKASVRRVLGDGHPYLASDANDLGMALWLQGRLGAAEEQLQEALAIGRERYGARHRRIGIYLRHLSRVLRDQERLEEAEMALRESIEIHREEETSDPSEVGRGMAELSTLLVAAERAEEAVEAAREALEVLASSPTPSPVLLADARHCLGSARVLAGDSAEGKEMMRESLEILEETVGDSSLLFETRQRHARVFPA